MTQRSEQLVLDYLSEVGLALHGRLTPRERTAYLRGLRARIDERRQAAENDDVDTARRILRGFGSPEHLVREELTGRELDLEDDEMIPPKPRHADRPPPPWRGGPSQGFLALLEGPGQTDQRMDGRAARRTGAVRGYRLILRHHPAEAVALAVLVLSGVWWDVAFLWVLGAVLVVLSQVWGARDKWIGTGVPLAACVVGTALWEGEAEFVDQYIQQALPATGVAGLGLASLACVLYLFPKAARAARAAEREAGSSPDRHRLANPGE
ncbi:hypothetical protein GCM10007079_15740 [Nocardiopsis terrae]|uniref:DUF1700 domain-containing protein n=1 Tax=Nocardiopsis terrae TaxID=372655 RepID=A0ABR9HB50_9ACTN|nr:hypothetical protein [Nocardiopsis terrae]MBE1456223.1 hypothetical protein [Nocardiopsis terrae]GHC78087.1 hypothetical protein GCM10007079_15740 [Nocardiopsis terrae]